MSLISSRIPSLLKTWNECLLIQSRNAARKGTRERRLKKKVKLEVQKVGFIPHNQRNREKFLAERKTKKFDDSNMRDPTDAVYAMKYYKWGVYPFNEALACHRETHHPEMYNQVDAPLRVIVELNMQGEKKTRFVENFNRICGVPHKFDHGETRTILAFAKDPQVQKETLEAGATLVGGVDLIKNIQVGKIALPDFQFHIAHPDILHELASLRGLMKKRFPNPKSGTLDIDLPSIVHRFVNGISYTAIKDEYEKDFGSIETNIGTLNMEAKHLEQNFAALINDVNLMKPNRPGSFITRVLLMSPPSREKFKVDHAVYLKEIQNNSEQKIEENEVVEERVVL